MRNDSIPKLQSRAVAQFFAPFLVALAFALWPHTASAATITVDGTTCTLPDAISAANADAATGGCTAGSGADTLLLTTDTYSLATGPYDHNGWTATPSINTTIVISGGADGAMVERSGNDPYRLFAIGKTGDLTLQKVTIRNGRVEANGGAIFSLGALTLSDCQLISNRATEGGGGVYNGGGTVTITYSHFIANTAEKGGGIFIDYESTGVFSDTHFISNTATVWGGGLATYGTITLTNSRFTSNKAKWWGGGLGADHIGADNNHTVILSETLFDTNSAYGGGGLATNRTTITLNNSRFISNTATAWGGGLDINNSTATFTDCEVFANRAGEGGGIANLDSATIFTNTHVVSNTAKVGGGIANLGRTITLINSEVRANVAISDGGGLYQGEGQTILISSRVLDNEAGDTGGALQQIEGSTTISQSCIVNNTDIAVDYAGGSEIDAAKNWWGAPDGPGGAGPGTGDGVSNEVAANPFLTSAILGCPLRVAPDGSPVGQSTGVSSEVVANDPENAQPAIRATPFPQRPILYLDFGEDAGIKAVERDGSSQGKAAFGALLGWSPQGDRFAYLAYDETGIAGLAIAALGEEGQLLYASEPEELIINTVHQSVWSPDGKQIALILFSHAGLQIVLIDADSGQVVRRFMVNQDLAMNFYDYASELGFRPTVDWSPDGQKLLLGIGDLVVLDLTSEEMKVVASELSAYWQTDQAQWLPSSDGVVYLDGSIFDGETITPPQLWRIGLDEEEPEMVFTTEQLVALGLDGSDQFYIKLSPMGTYLALGGINNGNDEGTSLVTTLLIFDVTTLEHGPIEPLGLPSSLAAIALPGMTFSIEWSPDEQELAFLMLSERDGATLELLPWSEGASRTLATVDLDEEADDGGFVNLVFMGFSMVSWMP